MDESKATHLHTMGYVDLEIDTSAKAIHCRYFGPHDEEVANDEVKNLESPRLIFTHGAGGTLTSPGIANFASGFGSRLPILCFQGNMNLNSRVSLFASVIRDQSFDSAVGGRSMGARAAIMAATPDTKYLVLVSYPLQGGKRLRDQILKDIDASKEVLFVIGDNDKMCNLAKLEQVRQKMACKSWRIVVEGADHGMDIRPKQATENVGIQIGETVARWIESHDDQAREARIFCDEDGKAEWTGWSSQTSPMSTVPSASPPVSEQKKSSTKRKRSVKP